MPDRIVFVLSTNRTGTKTLAQGLAGDDIRRAHPNLWASNCLAWGTEVVSEWMIDWIK